eukprot:TRINITY_DN7596_c1_g1_i2.p1 TRINITY_DN7596_c1_g1~~TRINITY_DN7596_c1_g1_i2.p1  ORF type:complete len:235 (-),score=51.59 TRINITY_DN7596_c1_g1_i2:21-725(-)
MEVFFVPGNNELRLGKKESFKDSIEKFEAVLQICEELGVRTSEMCIEGIVIVPLFAWYSPTFGNWDGDVKYRVRDFGIRSLMQQKRWLDFFRCRWPEEFDETKDPDCVASYFASLNKDRAHIYPDAELVISFSHFLPRKELLPSSMFLKDKTLPRVVGFDGLEDQIRSIESDIHCCGHTHINVDQKHGGIRYVQHALGHPNERKLWWRKMEASYEPKILYTKNLKDDEDASNRE